MRRFDGWSSGPVLLAGHGSTIASSKSSTPRLRIASCQRGSALTAASQSAISSSMNGGWTPSTGAHSVTARAVRSTVASYVVWVSLS